MKKKSASKSAFFNLRVLIGLCIALAGISLALLGLDAFAANTAPVKIKNHIITTSNDPLVPVGFDCTKIRQLGIDKQENFRAGAIMIACGAAEGGSGSSVGFFQRITQAVKKLLVPLYGAGDVNLITGTETSPNITQSETFTWANPDNPMQVVVAYNDSRGRNASPINISGASVSTDGGATFTRVTTASGQSPFANTDGDPVVLYNRAHLHLVHRVARMEPAAVRASVDTSPPIPRTRLAGPISVFTAAPRTTAILAGRITTRPLRLRTGCTFPGTILMWAAGLSL